MLVENKFFYIALPRCASTSFMTSCVKYNLNMQHFHDEINIDNQLLHLQKKLSEIDLENFNFRHTHESLGNLQKRFGSEYDIISVRRNKYERFISLWKHILHEMDLQESTDTFKKCSQLGLDELLFYSKYNNIDLLNEDTIEEIALEFIKIYKLNYIGKYGTSMIKLLVRPYSWWHQHNPNIIWFDFNELWKLEEWVSNKLNIDFKLINSNTSNHYTCNIKLNDEFKKKYDSIYSKYDEVKIIKTML